ncbi:MAG: DUF6090 family protein [Bacteroidota bacterium]
MGKYFKYAIGEILLVVIGILIALQINNWNEERIQANKEVVFLANINKEFRENKKQLDSVVNSHKLVFDNCSKIITYFPIKEKPSQQELESLAPLLFHSFGGTTFNPSQSSIRALSSSSSFNIIKDEKLRDLLISWNDLIIDYQEEEIDARTYIRTQYDPYMSKHFSWKFNFSDPRNDLKALQTLEFEYMIKNNRELLNQILNENGELQKLSKTIDMIIHLSNPKS